MAAKITQTDEIKKFLNVVSGMTSDKGNPRAKKIVHRILTDLFNTIEDLDVRPDEFWAAVDYFNDLGQHMEAGLLTPGLGLEHFLDLHGRRGQGGRRKARHTSDHRRPALRRERAFVERQRPS